MIDAADEAFIGAYLSGERTKVIAWQLGMTTSEITKAARRLGIVRRPPHRRPIFYGLPTPGMRAWINNEATMTNFMKAPTPPPAPTPTTPPPMPDVNSPANLAAQRLAQQRANSSGRASTQLTAPAAPTLAAGTPYAGTKTGA